MEPRIIPLGDSALIVELAEQIGEVKPERIREIAAWLQSPALPGVVEVVPAATTVTLFYQPLDLANGISELMDRVRERLAGQPAKSPASPSYLIEIPVCYGGAHGPDLESISKHLHLPVEEVVALHCGAEYQVLQLGFAPGFPYLVGLPEALDIPRLDTPRTSVPAGSVGIANGQSCIYPVAIPGGWSLIGRTPLKLFRPDQEPPVLLQAGDRVKFRPISAVAFERWEEPS